MHFGINTFLSLLEWLIIFKPIELFNNVDFVFGEFKRIARGERILEALIIQKINAFKWNKIENFHKINRFFCFFLFSPNWIFKTCPKEFWKISFLIDDFFSKFFFFILIEISQYLCHKWENNSLSWNLLKF